MIKHYCDICGLELTKKNSAHGGHLGKDRLGGQFKKGEKILRWELMTGSASTWNDADICKYCIIDAVNKLDDRPRAMKGE